MHAGGVRAEEFKLLKCATPGMHAVQARSSQDFARHTHEQFGIGFISSGAQRWHSGGKQVEAGAGATISVNAEEMHDGAPAGGAEREWCMIYIEPQLVLSAASDISERYETDFVIPNPVSRDPRAACLVLRLLDEESRANSPMASEELLLALLASLGEFRARPKPLERPVIGRARERMDDDPASSTGLQELADLCQLSRFQLIRAFAKSTGFTPHAYLVQRRARLARKLINRGLPLALAAVQAGFADQSHMTRVFRKQYGFSPGACMALRNS
jgi:AraC-like DNA-binding protein